MADHVFLEAGASRVLECWPDDVRRGDTTDLFRAVRAEEGEAVLLSIVEWPDKETRDRGLEKIEAMQKTDPRLDVERHPLPFDGKRMIFGGFQTILELEP